MSKLSIYRASAGSGKTFRLTVEYLKILLRNPSHYKNILAITFTNKATEEMKTRILKQLHLIANGETTEYLNLLQEETQLDTNTLQLHAKQAEKYILHDYSRFSVMTIDAFFQIVVKSFARELNLSHNYDIELEVETIKELALDRLFSQLDGDKSLRKWLKAFVQGKISDGKSWNISQDILRLSQELFSEKLHFLNRELIAQWSDKVFMNKYINNLDNLIFSYKDKMKKLGEKAMQEIVDNELTIADFSYEKNGVAGFLHKLSNGIVQSELSTRATKALEDVTFLYTKKTAVDIKSKIAHIYPTIKNILSEVQELISCEKSNYTTSLKIKKNIHIIGVFSDLAYHIYTLLQENNKMLLSESNKLLHEMIVGNEAPFIYEKIGTRYSYFLWDEFQDTSQMQWDNLKPLLSNALSTGNPCLIVGDTKQAIYRWRNGDWNILQKEVQQDFPNATELFLQRNWRSSTQVIDFNNALYETLPSLLEQELECNEHPITKLYKDATQNYGSDKQNSNGYVKLDFIRDTESNTSHEIALEKTLNTIIELQQQGVSPNDIVILVRKHKEAVLLTSFFMDIDKEKYPNGIILDVISDETLFLTASLTVRIIETALYYYLTQEYYYETSLKHLLSYLPTSKNLFEKWNEYTIENKSNIKRIGELVSICIEMFSLTEIDGEQLFLLGIEEEVLDFQNKNNGNPSAFLSWWEVRKKKAVVNPGELTNAIRIYTIHKSKGLEFEHVIIPFAEQPLESGIRDESLWASPTLAPFDAMEKVLLPYEKTLTDTIFRDEYLEEKKKKYIDLLNVFYVATTRAKTSLQLYFPMKKALGIGALLEQHIVGNSKESFWGQHSKADNANNTIWEYGKFHLSPTSQSIYLPNNISIQKPLHNISLVDRLSAITTILPVDSKQNLKSRSPISKGNLWHELLQHIYIYEDIPRIVKQFYYKGSISQTEQRIYREHLQKLLLRKEIAPYYTSQYSVYNERPILMNGQEYIPDRVVSNSHNLIVLEYKFGEQENPKYKKQLLQYKTFFNQRETKTVKAFLIYGLLDKIIEVQ